MALAAYPVALLVLALVCAFLIATSRGYQYTFGILLARLAHVFRSIASPSVFGHRLSLSPIANAIDGLNNYILAKLGEGIDATSHALVYVWGNLAHVVTELGDALGSLAEQTEQALTVLRRHTIPAMLTAAFGPGGYLLAQLLARIMPLVRAIPHAVDTVTHVVVHRVVRVEHTTVKLTKAFYRTVVVASSAAVAGILPRVGRLEREAETATKRLSKLEKGAAVVGVGTVAGIALGRLGLGWTRCSKVGRLGKAACGMDESLIESLIVGSLAIASTISIVELARECQAFTGEVDDAMRLFVRELR